MKRSVFPILVVIAAFCLLSRQVAAAEAGTNALPAVLTPYLQNPTANGMTVCFLAQGAEQVRVAWGVSGQSRLNELSGQGVAITGTPWTIWKMRLTNLRPGTAYQYQVRYSRPATDKVATPIYHFRTLDPRAKSVRVAAFNDLHNRDATLAALMQHVKPEEFEFSLLLGDCWGDPSAANGAYEVFRTLNAYVQLLDGANKPIILVRGNHETRGNFSRQMANLFDLPNLSATQKWGDDQWQFTLRAGPAFFVAMDTGEDDDAQTPENSYKNPKLWQAYRQREAGWLKNLLATKPGKDAAWRIFLSHIPLYNSPYCSESSRKYWEPLLRDFNPDLMLAGHDHTWRKVVPPTSATPWPVLVGGGPSLNEGTVMLLSADDKTLRVRLLGAKDGRVLTEFTTSKSH